MSLREIDLTLDSLFASDAHPSLRLTNEWQYHKERGAEDIRGSLLDIEIPLFIGFRRLYSDAALETDRIDYDEAFARIFGRYPKYYAYGYMGDGSQCDCCGRELNLLNRSPWCLCESCNADTDKEPLL